MKIITKQVEETVQEDVYENEVYMGTREVTKLVEKRFFSIPQPDKIIEEEVYLAELQQEKLLSEQVIIQAQEKIAEVETKLEQGEELLTQELKK